MVLIEGHDEHYPWRIDLQNDANPDLAKEPASTYIEGPNGKIPLIVAVHDQFTVRLNYYRTKEGVEAKFKPAEQGTAPEDMTVEERVHNFVMSAFDAGHKLVAIGRAEPGESFGDALSAIEKFEKRVMKR